MDIDIKKEHNKLIIAKLVSTQLEISYPSNLTECPICHKSYSIRNYRINTAYNNDADNWQESCHDCYLETVAHYRELWNEYYNSQRPL